MEAENKMKPGKGTGAAGRTDSPQVGKPEGDPKRVNVDFPGWMVDRLDREAARLGVSRQSLIKFWVGERLDALSAG